MWMARVTVNVCFDEIQLQISEDSFQQWATQVQTCDYSLPIFLSDLLRRNALVEVTFEGWTTLAYHKTMTKAAFRAWSRETTPPLALDWDVIEASHSLTQEQLDQLGFRQLNFDATDRIDWQDFVAVGETEQQEYQPASQHEQAKPII
jgi:hypothetical protein